MFDSHKRRTTLQLALSKLLPLYTFYFVLGHCHQKRILLKYRQSGQETPGLYHDNLTSPKKHWGWKEKINAHMPKWKSENYHWKVKTEYIFQNSNKTDKI